MIMIMIMTMICITSKNALHVNVYVAEYMYILKKYQCKWNRRWCGHKSQEYFNVTQHKIKYRRKNTTTTTNAQYRQSVLSVETVCTHSVMGLDEFQRQTHLRSENLSWKLILRCKHLQYKIVYHINLKLFIRAGLNTSFYFNIFSILIYILRRSTYTVRQTQTEKIIHQHHKHTTNETNPNQWTDEYKPPTHMTVDLWNSTIHAIYQWIMKKLAHYQVMKVCKCVRPQPFKDQVYHWQRKNCYSIHQAQNTEAQRRIRCSFSHLYIWAKVCPIWIWMHHKPPIIRCLYLAFRLDTRIYFRRVNVASLIHHHHQHGKFFAQRISFNRILYDKFITRFGRRSSILFVYICDNLIILFVVVVIL